MTDPEQVILDMTDEKEVLYGRVCRQALIGLSALKPTLTVGEHPEAIAGMVVVGVLEALRNMSGRQLAVLLAREASYGVQYELHEPPRYTPDEIANVS